VKTVIPVLIKQTRISTALKKNFGHSGKVKFSRQMKRSGKTRISRVDIAPGQCQISNNELVPALDRQVERGTVIAVFGSGVGIDADLDQKEDGFGVFFVDCNVEKVTTSSELGSMSHYLLSMTHISYLSNCSAVVGSFSRICSAAFVFFTLNKWNW